MKTKSSHRLSASILLSATTALYLFGCSAAVPSAPTPVHLRKTNQQVSGNQGNSDASNLDPASWKLRLSALKDDAAQVAEQLTDVNTQLAQISSVKNALCRQQSLLLSSCLVHTPLSATNWKTGTACDNSSESVIARTFTVDLRGITGRFQLILDNSIESNIFESGKIEKLQFSSRGSRSLKDLKFSDIASIKLKAIAGTLNNLQTAFFSLKIDDQTLLSESDFLLSSRTDSSVTLSQLPLTNELASTECRVDENEIESVVQDALKNVNHPQKIEPPVEKSDLTVESNAKEFENWLSENRKTFTNRSDTYLASAQDVSRLRRNLRGELQLGCWSRETIKSLEIIIDGNALPSSDWDRSQTRVALGTTGQPAQTTIDLGGGLRFTNGDEKVNQLFRKGGQWLLSVKTDLTIGDISSIQLQKDGYSYDAFHNCWDTWGGLGRACEWQNRENNRYQMNSLSIKINGMIVYQKDAVNAVFERKSLKWLESDLTKNQAYVDLMRRRDCPVSPGFH